MSTSGGFENEPGSKIKIKKINKKEKGKKRKEKMKVVSNNIITRQ